MRRSSARSADPHARRPEAAPAQRGRLPARQADPGEILPRRRGRTTSPGSSRNCSAIAKRWLRRVRHAARTTPSRNCCCSSRFAHDAADRIYQAIVASADGAADASSRSCGPTTRVGSTRYVDFDTTKPTYATRRRQVPRLPRRRRHRLGAEAGPGARRHGRGRSPTSRTRTSASPSPTRSTATSGSYYPDFIVRLDDGRGADDLLNLIVEVTGERKKDKAAKVDHRPHLWVPAVNNHGGFGRWAFLEIDRPVGRRSSSIREPR